MRMTKKSFIGIILIWASICLCKGHIYDVTKYKQMPPLYLADDYDQCLSPEQPSAAYCVVYAEIQPQPQSPLWQHIDEFYKNSTRTHFRHDQLYRGVCTTRCRDYAKSMPHWNVRDVQPSSDNVQWAQLLHTLSRKQKSILEYEQQLHQCVNADMKEKYNLNVKTFVKYCDNPKEPLEKDNNYHRGIQVIMAIIAINLLSTIYDALLKSQGNEKNTVNYYDTKHKKSVNHFLTTFSIFRNFRRLVKPNNSAIGKDLSFIDGFRTIMSSIIVFEHVIFIQFFPHKNTEFLENEYSSTFAQWLSHLMPCIELFFLMSGLMLYIKFAKSEYISPQSSWSECVRVYGRMMISRYFRYIPSLLFLIFFTSHVLMNVGDGPFWRHSIEPTVFLCRTKWLSNIFMTANNNPNTSCWFHLWYIAADFKLYAFFLAVLVLCAKCPQYKKLIYSIIAVLGLSIVSIINYVQKSNSIATMMIENYRHFYFKNIYKDMLVYSHCYSNLNGMFLGIICGELYMKYLKHDKYKKSFGHYLHWAPVVGWSTLFFIWYLGTKIIFTECTIWTALFVIPHRHLGIATVATVVIIRGMCTGGGFLSWPIFRLLARVSYQVYLWHLIIIFLIYSSYRTPPLIAGYQWLFGMVIIIYIIAAMLATVIATMVEYPIAEIFAEFDLKSKPKPLRSSKD